MFRRLRSVAAFASAVLVTALLVALTPGGGQEAKATLGPIQAVTLGAADFHPVSPGSFGNTGYNLYSEVVQVARIPFPAEVVVVTSIKASAHDDYPSADLCVKAYRANPGNADEVYWGQDCTSGTSAADPQTLSITAFKRVGRFHTAYLWAYFGAFSAQLSLYGATVFYRVVT